LLGPSGCGKTSLIRTLVGRLHPIDHPSGTRGTISILGKNPYAFGQLVGFMPQEMALHSTNTIDEELFFYGRLANMPSQKIQQRCQFLINLLELPHQQKLISKLRHIVYMGRTNTRFTTRVRMIFFYLFISEKRLFN